MISSVSRNMKYEGSMTPLTYLKNTLKPASRELLQKDSFKSEHDDWNTWKKYRGEKWDGIESPQFVDFINMPNDSDCSFNKCNIVASTPKLNFEDDNLSMIDNEEENTLMAGINNIDLSSIKQQLPGEDCTVLNNQEDKEEYVVHKISEKMMKKDKKEGIKPKKRQYTTVVPFTFDSREKNKQEYKQERIKKMQEKEEKVKIFRAKPVPKFLKIRPVLGTNNNDNNSNNNDIKNKDNHNEAVSNNDKKSQRTNAHGKPTKKNVEIWKKPPFAPSLTRECLKSSKIPHLRTAIRAQKRKQFDDTIRQKERQREQRRQMEIAARKKEEDEENVQLRKQTVHKAQPIRKYKTDLPKVEKRSLTDPLSPLLFKRRRRV